MTFPKTDGSEWGAAQSAPWVPHNESMRRLDAAVSRWIVADRDLTAPPGSCVDGANYLVASSPTGAWAGQAGKLATAVGTNAANGWLFTTVAVNGYRIFVQDENQELRYNGSSWASEGGGGKFTLPVMAPAMVARSTNGAASASFETATNKVMYRCFDFDQSTDEFVQFSVPMFKRWNEGTLTYQVIWTASATGDAVWSLQAVAVSNDDPIDAAFGTAVSVTDGVTAANDLMFTSESAAVTVGGTPAENDMVIFQLSRDADNGSDTLSGDARLIGVLLFINTNASDDS